MLLDMGYRWDSVAAAGKIGPLSERDVTLTVGFSIRSWCWDPNSRDRHLRKKFRPQSERPNSVVYTRKTKKIWCLGIRVLRSKPQRWIPELRFGYPPLSKFFESFWEKLGISLESLGWSPRQLCIKTGPMWHALGSWGHPKSPQNPKSPKWLKLKVSPKVTQKLALSRENCDRVGQLQKRKTPKSRQYHPNMLFFADSILITFFAVR